MGNSHAMDLDLQLRSCAENVFIKQLLKIVAFLTLIGVVVIVYPPIAFTMPIFRPNECFMFSLDY